MVFADWNAKTEFFSYENLETGLLRISIFHFNIKFDGSVFDSFFLSHIFHNKVFDMV